MENQKQKKSAGTVVLVVLLLIVTIAALILATYAWARYTTTTTGEAAATVAKWDVSFTPGTLTYQESTFVKTEKLAPGMSGSISLPFTSANTEVAYDYVVSIQNLKNKPVNLHFYATRTGTGTDADPYVFTDEITTFDQALSGAVTLDSNGKATVFGTVHYNGIMTDGTVGASTTGTAVTSNPASNSAPVIYWNWDYKTTTTRNAVPTTVADSATNPITSTEVSGGHTIATYASPASTANMTQAMSDLANAVAVRNGGDATTYATAAAALTAATTGGASALEINDAIDTAEGMTAPEMTFNIVFTATQHEPTKNVPSNVAP